MTQRMMQELGLTMKNPDPALVMLAEIRKQKLTAIANMPLDCESVKPADVIKAIDVMNKMEGMYLGNQPVNFKQINIVLVEKGGLPGMEVASPVEMTPTPVLTECKILESPNTEAL